MTTHAPSPDGGIAKPVKRGRPPKGEEAAIAEQIVTAATTLFLSRGYENTSTDEVAAAACCSKRTLYTRFGTKADLFEAVILRFVRDNYEVRTPGVRAGRTLSERLHSLAVVMVEALTQPDILKLHFLLQSEARRFPELMTIAEKAGRTPLLKELVDILCSEKLSISTEPEVHFLAETFVFLIQGPIFQAAISGVVEDKEKAFLRARYSVEFFLRGCARQ